MFLCLVVALWMACEATGATSPLSGLVPLGFSQEPTYTVAHKNEPVRLNCGVDGTPPPSRFTWEKDGQAIIADSSRTRIEPSGALLITRIIHTREYKPDVGEYQCFASSSSGRIASHKVHLDVAGMSKKFLSEPQSTITWVGSVARFSCQIRHAIPPATVTWEKDGSALNPSDRIVILKEGVLQINDVRKTDAGNYRCVAKNTVKTRYSNPGSLTVADSSRNKTSLKFLGEHHNVTIVKGGSAILECVATGYPVPLVQWKKLEGHVRTYSVSNVTHGINNLNFTNVDENNGGQYECQAYADGKTISKTVWLIVRVPPRFTTKPSRLVWTTVGPTEFRCAATGVPLPSLYWLKNGKELSSSGSAKITYHKGRADLTLSSVTPSDAAMYQCFAKNEAGSIQAGACLIVQRIEDQPGPPINVVALPFSSSSIIISWSPPVGNFSIRAYTVHFRQLGKANSKENQDVVSKGTHSFEVKRLLGYTNYSLYVKAYTKTIGKPSETIVQRTRQDRPARPPVNLKVSSHTPDSLDVEWEPPPRDYQNGIITKYVISYEESDRKGVPSFVEVPGQTLKKTINGLSKGASYSIKVAAATVKGEGPRSRPVAGTVIQKPSNEVISPPTLWIAAKNSSVVLVKWLPPKYGQASIEEYHLFYVQIQEYEKEKGPFIVGRQHQSYSLRGLSPGSQYFIKLMAWNGKKSGQPGAVYVTTDIDPGARSPSPTNPGLPPSRPIHLVCSVDSPTSILLTWQRPLSAERITYYTVTYHLRSSLNPVPIKRRVNAENIILPELKPGREYTISVQSHHRTETKTPPDFSTTYKNCKLPLSEPSSPPRNVKFEYKTVRSVELMWETPLNPNGELISFEVLYTYNKSYPDSMWTVESQPLGLLSSKSKLFSRRLIGIKEGATFYLKIRAENKQGFGPFSDTVTIQPPSVAPRVAPNVTFTILSGQVQLSWLCPRVFDAFIESFTILITNDTHLPEDKWIMQTVSVPSTKRFPNVVTTTVYVKQTFMYVKVRAEYDDRIPGKWSKIIKISADEKEKNGPNNSLTTRSPRLSELGDNPETNVKLGIIIGCTISAFCIVVLLLFIVWRNPCRQYPVQKSAEKAAVSGLPPMNGLLPSHQQIAVSARQDNSASTEETSASSGLCQCKCTCGAARWPLGPTMVRTNNKIPGSSDSSTPITQVFSQSSPGDSEESGSGQDLRTKRDHRNNPGSSSSSLSVESHRDEQINTITGSSKRHKQSISVDV